MNAERVLNPTQNKDNLPSSGRKPSERDGKKKYCGVCPVCNKLKSVSVSSPQMMTEILKRDRSTFLENRNCVSGFLQKNYGNIFTQSVMDSLYKDKVSDEVMTDKKVLRLPVSEKAIEQSSMEGLVPQAKGRHLDHHTRSFMESRIGQPFGDVRVHTGSDANRNARLLNAHAYTAGKDIFFGAGKYKPESKAGRKLIAHELIHVTQNKSMHSNSNYKLSTLQVSSPGDAMERQADLAASAVVMGEVIPFRTSPVQRNSKAVYRKTVDEEKEEKSGWLAEKLAEYASNVPGFTLVTFILGKNPITGQAVERNAKTFLEAIFGLIPGGGLLFKNLNESGVIDQAFEWINKEIKALNITWEFIKGLIGQAWDIVKEWSLPATKIKNIIVLFEPVYQKIKTFCIELGKKVMNFIFEAVLKKVGAEKLIEILKRAGEAINIIASDPIKFLRYLLDALKKGFNQFVSNIWEHLKAGLFGWLFGALASAGIKIPKSFDLKSIFGLVMQVLGLTAEFLRKKIAKVIGERNLDLIEKAWSFISTIISSGISGLWEMIKEYVGNLKDIVLGAIHDWVVTKIITAAITKLVSMFNPVGAIITAVQTIYNTVMFFIERMQQIMAVVDSIIQSILPIAQGAIDKAADWIEKTMARTLPVIISFLARMIGLGGISEKIKGIIKKLQDKVEKAVDKVIDKVVGKVKGLLGKVLPGKKEKPMSPEVQKRWDAGMAEIEALKKKSEKDPEDEDEIKTDLSRIKSKYGFKRLDYKPDGNEWAIEAIMNPEKKIKISAATSKDEGEAGHHESLPRKKGVFERNHIPQSAIMKFVRENIEDLKFEHNVWNKLKGWSHGKGIAIVMSKKRHIETRTWGRKGEAKNILRENKENVQKFLPGSDENSRKQLDSKKRIITLLKKEMGNDKKDVDEIYKNDKSVNADLHGRLKKGLTKVENMNNDMYLN